MKEFADELRGLSPQKLALLAIELRSEIDRLRLATAEPIALAGIGCRFPGGANSPDEYWDMLLQGRDAITEIPPERWPVDAYYDPDPDAPGKMYTKYGGFVEGIDLFDPQFFGISPREAASMDPQQRLFLEVAWEALEDAGYTAAALAGSSTGVFVGACLSDYWVEYAESRVDAHAGSGNAHSVIANRLSYALDLRGPSLAVDSACSSSLVAVHLACQSLRRRECRLALAGGVSAMVSPKPYMALAKAHMLAPDGRCKTFDARADGYVRGEGCGIVALKRLSDARADGDRIIALVRGSAVNQDGRSNGLTASNLLAQQVVVREALEAAGVVPSDIGYVEAHGTGTSLGDPIEVEALKAVFGRNPSRSPCAIGTVKTNIGHLEAAAGIAGLIKAALAVERGEIPGNLHFRHINPNISLAGSPFVIATRNCSWPEGYPARVAGVSSFGFGGTNAHVVVAEPPVVASAPSDRPDRSTHIVCVSAKSTSALRQQASRLAARARTLPPDALPDLAYTANAGRSHFSSRLSVIAHSMNELVERLDRWVAGHTDAAVRHGEPESPPRIAFLFTGQGAQRSEMARDLFTTEGVFREAVEQCDRLFRPYLSAPLLSVLYGQGDLHLDQTEYTQPALFSLEYAMASLWRSWGVEPSMLLGHSIGEYAAACVAGVYDLKDAVALVATRARLMQALSADGAMAAVLGDRARATDTVREAAGEVDIAAINGPSEIVISGARRDVEAACERLAADGFVTKQLRVSHAFHSPLMEPMLDELARAAARLPAAAPRIPLVSNLTGTLMTVAPDGGYWRRHARETVQFADGVATLAANGISIGLEVGPAPTLSILASRCSPAGTLKWLPSLRPGRDDWSQVLDTLATVYVNGAAIDWAAFDRDRPRRRLRLPTYAFQRERFWVAAGQPTVDGRSTTRRMAATAAPPAAPMLDRRIPLPFGKEIRFELRLLPERLAYLADHRVRGAVLFPAAGFVELALEAAADIAGPAPRVIDDLVLLQPFVIDVADPAGYEVQVIIKTDVQAVRSFRIVGRRASGEAEWTLYASGKWTDKSDLAPSQPELLDSLASRCPEEIDRAAYYAWLARLGLEYGERFRTIESIRRGSGSALARVRLANDLGSGPRYQVHPALFDGCLQAVGAAVAAGDLAVATDDLFLPIGLGHLEIDGAAPPELSAFVEITSTSPAPSDIVTASLLLFDDSGRRIATATDLRFKRVRQEAVVEQRIEQNVYEIVWRQQLETVAPGGKGDERVDQARRWIIFADSGGVGERLAEHLHASGGRCLLVTRGSEYRRSSDRVVTVDPQVPEHFVQLLEAADEDGNAARVAVVHLWNLDHVSDMPGDLKAVHEAETDGCASLLHLVQAAVARRPFPIWIATAGVQAIDEAGALGAPVQAASWGFARALAQEHPEFSPVLIDLDLDGGPEESAKGLLSELKGQNGENQIAWRGGNRYVARLQRPVWQDLIGPEATAESYRLEIARRGVLDQLALVPAWRTGPRRGEVEIEVSATGLNFRDVLNVLDLYPGDAGPLGLECVGRIAAVGESVHELKVGQEVVAIAPASFSGYVTIPKSLVVVKPEGLPVADAATLPVTFLTAMYALHSLARIQRGDRVLIHAAAGGVGLAAVQLAQLAGAQVFATAGSDAKRQYLRSIGVQWISDSRSASFVEDIRRWAPERIDIVLNSLAGELVEASLSLLADRGRFVEIGKSAGWNADRVAGIRPDVSYWAFDLGEVVRADPTGIQRLLSTVMADVESGRIRPLPHRVFPLTQVVSAFRHMAQTKHIGKIVIMHDRPDLSRRPREGVTFDDDGAYVVTGGFGALGLQIAAWAVARGARRLFLIGRRAPSAEAHQVISQLRSAGAEVGTACADVSDRTALARVLEECSRSLGRIRGVVHAAGVLDDGVIRSQPWGRWEPVLAPKVDGAFNLDTLTSDLTLDWFVLFSSATSVFGSPGQASYASANAVLDALAHYRLAHGKRALSISWGPWAGSGMAQRVNDDAHRRWAAQGIQPLEPGTAFAALGRLLDAGIAHAAVVPIDWAQVVRAGRAVPPLLSDLVNSRLLAAEKSGIAPLRNVAEDWRSAPAARRRALIVAHVRSIVATVLGLDANAGWHSRQPLGELGLDSLMAVEIRNAISRSVERALPATLLFDYPTIDSLAAYLEKAILGDVLAPESESPGPDTATGVNDALEDALVSIEGMSDQDVEAALLSRLKV